MEEELQVRDIRSQRPDEPNHRFLNESVLLEGRWDKIGLLEGVKDEHQRRSIAVCLENQRLMNEVATGAYGDEMRKKLVPLVRQVFGSLKAWNWVNVQPMLGPTGLIFYMRRRESGIVIESEDISARTRLLKRVVADDFGPKDAAFAIAEEIDTEIVTDLWNNCSLVRSIEIGKYNNDAAQLLRQQVVLLQDDMRQKGLDPTFAIVNRKLHSNLGSAFTNLGNRLSIYPHELVEGVLLGFRGESYMDSGYAYSPYVPFTFTPRDANYGLLMRYGKKLMREGSKYYGKVVVKTEFNEYPE